MKTLENIEAAILDLDGVVTETASLHSQAWKKTFDEFLKKNSKNGFTEFSQEDYIKYLDGLPRYNGIEAFLNSREIDLDQGRESDEAGSNTIRGLGKQKNKYFNELLEREGPKVFDDSLDQIKTWKQNGIKLAIVSSSKNCKKILNKAGIIDLFEVCIDGNEIDKRNLRGKPEPDLFLKAVKELHSSPKHSFIVEDAISGVQAGKRGNFAYVIGINRSQENKSLKEHGADFVIRSLKEIELAYEDAKSFDFEDEIGVEDWSLIYNDWNPDKQKLRESLCTLANGYFATRGAFEEGVANKSHYPGTYLAGGFNRAESDILGKVIENEDLVNWPNWLYLQFRIEDGDWFDLDNVKINSFEQKLCVKNGLLKRTIKFQDDKQRKFKLQTQRFVSMANPHLAGIKWSLKALNWQGSITIRSGIDGRIKNQGVSRYQDLNSEHIKITDKGLVGEDGIYLVARTKQSDIKLAQAVKTTLSSSKNTAIERNTFEEQNFIYQELGFNIEQHKSIDVEKIVSLYSSKDFAISEAKLEACNALANSSSFDSLFETHQASWQKLWNQFDISFDNGLYLQFILRLHIFHLIQTTSLHSIDMDVSVPARGLHGEAYRGHIFWDELFIFPFLNLRMPELTKSLLMYRYRRLEQAKHIARSINCKGAIFPWQSGSNGREECPAMYLNSKSNRWIEDHTYKQRHVSAAIAYNIWQYYQATNDLEFISSYGAKMFLEIARGFASLAKYNLRKNRYEIKNVVGPDEFHVKYPGNKESGIDNNAYTNIMASWTLDHAYRVFELLTDEDREELKNELKLDDEELVEWEQISKNLFLPFISKNIIAQFEDYENLEELDWESYRKKYKNIQRLDLILEFENDSVNRYKVSKQADLIMIFYLFSAEELEEIFKRLGYSFKPEMIPLNIDYYLKRVSHGSTLSRIVHAWVLARGDRSQSWCHFKEALKSDISDIQGGTTSEGIHLGAMAGTVDILQRCYTGLEMRDNILWFNPMLPEELGSVSFKLHYQGHNLHLRITQKTMFLKLSWSSCGTIKIGFKNETHELERDREYEFTYRS